MNISNQTTTPSTLFNLTALCLMTSLQGNSSDNNTVKNNDVNIWFDCKNKKLNNPSLKPFWEYGEFKAAKWFSKNSKFIVMCLGYPGNIAAIITVCRMKPFTTSSLFMVMLAIMDTATLLSKEVYYRLTFHDVRLYDFGCQTMLFLGAFTMQYANWILVLMTAERFIAVRFPMKVQKISTKTKVAILLAVVAVILIGLNAHLFVTIYEKLYTRRGYVCTVKPEHAYFYLVEWYWVENSVFGFIPCVAVFVLNIMIIVCIRISIKKQKDLTAVDQNKSKQQMQITVMLVTVSVIFVILTMSNTIFLLYFVYIGYYQHRSDHYHIAVLQLTSQLVFLLTDFNNATNFYFYFLSGRRFRKHFIQMICCCCPKRKSRETTETSVYSKSTRY
ncbi:type-1 angiotensin II receptor-like [Ostrea edulis]|uniref:type-1 angiotensin II receptor-like n=1 Tax=Ostrea edulis TaxID=37623 RepID=UPI0024AEC09C|nr:type-1 angiotensin II receptor-like [Ostrea edulis]